VTTEGRIRRHADEAKAAILAAAEVEFARAGVAGARIDRIAENAQASKERLYKYFGDKQSLFEQVREAVLHRVSTAVVIDADDLPGYTARLVRYFHAHPDDVRMAAWANLEGASPQYDTAGDPTAEYLHKLSEVRRAQRRGMIDPSWEPAELLQLVLAIALFWTHDPHGASSDVGSTEAIEHAAEEAVRRLVNPPPHSGASGQR